MDEKEGKDRTRETKKGVRQDRRGRRRGSKREERENLDEARRGRSLKIGGMITSRKGRMTGAGRWISEGEK